jgi:phosphoglycerate dehydrogenase-like enzyme
VRIVATAEVPPAAHRAFAGLGEIVVQRDPGDALSAEVLIVRGTPVGAEALGAAARLRAIARTGAGFDNLDVAAATRLGIPIVYAPGVGSQPVAEGTIALLLAAAKRLRELGGLVGSGSWSSRYDVAVLDLAGATLGIVGYGSIGRRVAGLARGLGMEVIAHDPAIHLLSEGDTEIVSLEELLERANALTFHCALNETTRGLVSRRFLARVKPGAVLVNVARGALVESEDVLADALAGGRLSGVALDVFPSEPPDPSHRLYADPRVICTPHSVGLTQRWNESVFAALAGGVRDVLSGERPANLLNPEALTGHRATADRGGTSTA